MDDDGYYDLQISVKEVRGNGYAELEFKEIHEEVPASEREGKKSPSKFGIKLEIWIAGGIVLLVFILGVIKNLVKKKKKRKRKKHMRK